MTRAAEPLILASQSATRQRLLRNAGIAFEAVSAFIDERAIENQAALGKTARRDAIALALAEHKALAVSAGHPGRFVVGADQTLDFDGTPVHKPSDSMAAARQLRAMAGKTHHLHSAVALARDGEVLWRHVESAAMTLKPFSAKALERVLAMEGHAILSSVGGYRLEGPSIQLFAGVTGDYFTVLGLPLLPLIAAIERFAPQLLEIR